MQQHTAIAMELRTSTHHDGVFGRCTSRCCCLGRRVSRARRLRPPFCISSRRNSSASGLGLATTLGWSCCCFLPCRRGGAGRIRCCCGRGSVFQHSHSPFLAISFRLRLAPSLGCHQHGDARCWHKTRQATLALPAWECQSYAAQRPCAAAERVHDLRPAFNARWRRDWN